jgi:galactonate dehydratase
LAEAEARTHIGIGRASGSASERSIERQDIDMQITGLRPFFVNPGGIASWGTGHVKNYVFVKVYTDAGIDGLGEAFHSLDEPIEGALRKFERYLVGRDPTRIQHNWQAIYRGLRYPLGTAELAALSAVEHALWDIAGKACGLPVYKMLGGETRDRIRLYASPGALKGADLAEAAAGAVRRGFTALKITPQPNDYPGKPAQLVLRESLERVAAVRNAVGPDVDIALDYHGRSFSPVEAVRLAQALSPYNIFFLEEPALSESPDSLVEVKAKTTIPIAAGERCVTRADMRRLIEKRAVDIFQPEPTANGGILETFKLAALAEMQQIVVAPHQACGPVSLAVCAHIDASIPNFLIQELNFDLDSQCLRDVISRMPTIRDGYLQLPERPGLGVELNEDAAAAYPARPYDRPLIACADGSIGLE